MQNEVRYKCFPRNNPSPAVVVYRHFFPFRSPPFPPNVPTDPLFPTQVWYNLAGLEIMPVTGGEKQSVCTATFTRVRNASWRSIHTQALSSSREDCMDPNRSMVNNPLPTSRTPP